MDCPLSRTPDRSGSAGAGHFCCTARRCRHGATQSDSPWERQRRRSMRSLSRVGPVLVATSCLMLSSVAFATPLLQQQFLDRCRVRPGSRLEQAHCRTCHSELPRLNPFGRDVQAEMAREKNRTFSRKLWRRLGPLDSDRDGVSNRREIEAGTLPGDAKSKPAVGARNERMSSHRRFLPG
jgi:hypothetical protein